MEREEKKEIIRSLYLLSDRVGTIITEYDWRELASIYHGLIDEWGITAEEWNKIVTDEQKKSIEETG